MTLAAVTLIELPTRLAASGVYPETWVFDLSVPLGCIALRYPIRDGASRPGCEPDSTLPATAVHTSPPSSRHECGQDANRRVRQPWGGKVPFSVSVGRPAFLPVSRETSGTGPLLSGRRQLAKSSYVSAETGGRQGPSSDSLTCVPTPSLASLPIRRLTLRDLAACADLSEDRGWPREEHKWGFLLTAGKGYGIDDPEGGLLSACVVTEYGPQNPALAAIGMVLVAGRHARQGVGRRLMRHVVSAMGTTPLTLHATPNGRPLYEELGFKVTGRAEMVLGHLTPGGPEPEVATRAATAEDLTAILRLDEQVFGSDRTHIVTRLPAFADQLRVAEDGGQIIGYAAAWPNMDTHVVGPLIARDTSVAQALIASLAARTDRPLRTDIDVRHEELLAWVKERGLQSVAFNSVMAYGIAELPGDWSRRFAPVTVAAG